MAALPNDQKAWTLWLKEYGIENFIQAFIHNVEGARSRCQYCHQKIYVDVLIGGGVPDWSTKDGDFGCPNSPDTNEEGCGGHMPVKRKERGWHA